MKTLMWMSCHGLTVQRALQQLYKWHLDHCWILPAKKIIRHILTSIELEKMISLPCLQTHGNWNTNNIEGQHGFQTCVINFRRYFALAITGRKRKKERNVCVYEREREKILRNNLYLLKIMIQIWMSSWYHTKDPRS